MSEEIDIIEILKIFLKNKYKILITTLIPFFAVLFYIEFEYSKNTILRVNTEIKPISSFEEIKYENFNLYLSRINQNLNTNNTNIENSKINMRSNNKFKKEDYLQNFGFDKIDKSYLLNLFLEKLNDNLFLINAINETEIIDKKNFSNDKAYEDEIIKFKSSIKVFKDGNLDNPWKINFDSINLEKSKKFLKHVEKKTNEEIQNFILNNFNKKILNQKNINNYLIEDLEYRKLNLMDMYEKNINNRLVFLKEQAQIARKLNINKNSTSEAQTIITESGSTTKLRSELAYYMRGYEAIEEEIRLIENRKNKEAFIKEIIFLEEKKKELILNKDIKRLNNILKETPINYKEEFYAAKINSDYINFTVLNHNFYSKKYFYSLLAGLCGAIFCAFYILIVRNVKNYK